MVEQMIRTSEEQMPIKLTLFVDGSCANGRSGAGLIPTCPKGFEIKQTLKFNFKITTNEEKFYW